MLPTLDMVRLMVWFILRQIPLQLEPVKTNNLYTPKYIDGMGI